MTQTFTGPYQDRSEAGRVLALHLSAYQDDPRTLILAIPRGGVPVAFEIARALEAPLDIFMVRKLRTPANPELAMGAVASSGICVLNQDVIRGLGISQSAIDQAAEREAAELKRREEGYRGSRPALDIRGRTVILVDDGLATGSSMRAAISAARVRNPKRVIAAAPVGTVSACQSLRLIADDVVCPLTPEPFAAVGRWYRDFSPTMDRHIHDLLEHSLGELAATH